MENLPCITWNERLNLPCITWCFTTRFSLAVFGICHLPQIIRRETVLFNTRENQIDAQFNIGQKLELFFQCKEIFRQQCPRYIYP